MWLTVTSTARTCSVSSLIPRWILRQTRRFGRHACVPCSGLTRPHRGHGPFAPFALDLDAGAIDQQVQWPLGAAVGDVHGQGLLAAGQRAEVGHRPVQTDQPQQALDEAGRLPERHAEQHLHRESRLYSGVAVALLAATSACRRAIPAHLRTEPDRQRATALERFVIGRPVPRPVDRGCRSAHVSQLPYWINEMNPSRDLCNRAVCSQSDPAAKAIAVQLGARRRYAVPAALAHSSQLEALYTDLCAGRGVGRLVPALTAVPSLARHLNISRRTPPSNVIARTRTFPTWFLEIQRALKRTDDPHLRIRMLRNAHSRASTRMVRAGFGKASHVIAMLGEGLEFQTEAKARGLVTASDIVIAPSTEAIVRDEQRRFPDWEAPKIYYGQTCADEAGVTPLMDEVLAATDIFLCPSEFVRHDLITNFGVTPDRTRLVHYPIPPKGTEIQQRPVPGRVLFAGTAELRKGIHVLADAARLLHNSHGAIDVRVAGGVTQTVRDRPECAALTFLGRLNATAMQQAYATADLVVLPSLAEGSAGVIYEALSYGIPVVTTFESGSVVRDWQDGRIIPARNAEALAQVIEEIVLDRSMRAQMAHSAQAHSGKYSWAEYGESLRAALFSPLDETL